MTFAGRAGLDPVLPRRLESRSEQLRQQIKCCQRSSRRSALDGLRPADRPTHTAEIQSGYGPPTAATVGPNRGGSALVAPFGFRLCGSGGKQRFLINRKYTNMPGILGRITIQPQASKKVFLLFWKRFTASQDSEAVNQLQLSVDWVTCPEEALLTASCRAGLLCRPLRRSRPNYRGSRRLPRLAPHYLSHRIYSLHIPACAATSGSATARVRLWAKAYHRTTASLRRPRTRNRRRPRFRAKAFTHSAVAALRWRWIFLASSVAIRCRHSSTAGLSGPRGVWGSRFGSFDSITGAYTVVPPCGGLNWSISAFFTKPPSINAFWVSRNNAPGVARPSVPVALGRRRS